MFIGLCAGGGQDDAVGPLRVVSRIISRGVSSRFPLRPQSLAVCVCGTTDIATTADYLGTIAWRSAEALPKTETLPACGVYNNGTWIKVVDGLSDNDHRGERHRERPG